MDHFYRLAVVRRMERWFNAMPHPSTVVEIASDHVAAARWSNQGGNLESFSTESLPVGSVMPSPMETNVTQPGAVQGVLRRVLGRIPDRGSSAALLIPDPVARVFILPFDSLPRRRDEALPLLRWRLKKSVPFDVDETVLSWMRQGGRLGNLEVVVAIARDRIIREYEEILEGLDTHVTVVMSSTLATLPLLDETGSTLLVRMSGKTLTTAIVQGPNLCVYRSSEMAIEATSLDPQVMLEEIFPAVAYYQDTFGDSIDHVRLAGFSAHPDVFCNALAAEMKVEAGALADSAEGRRLESSARDLIRQNMDALVGWMMNGAA
jgi:type IV pilus assembly protein PilM